MGKEVAKVEPGGFLAFKNDAEVKAVIDANIGAGVSVSPLELERTKLPTGGGQAWQLGDDVAKTFDCIIAAWHNCRGYWPGEFGSNTPPQCSSPDGITGYGDPGGACRNCPHDWKNDRNSGQPTCKEKIRLFLIREGRVLPTMLSLPVMSIKPFRAYMLELTSSHVKIYHDVVTRIGLSAEKNQGGINFSAATFEFVEALSGEMRAKVRAYAESIAPLMATPVTGTDGGGEDAGPVDLD